MSKKLKEVDDFCFDNMRITLFERIMILINKPFIHGNCLILSW